MLAKHHSTPPASSLRVRDAGEDTYDAPIKLVKRGATVTSAIGRPCQAIVHDRGTWCRDCPTTRAATSRRTCLGIVRIRNAGGAVALWLVAARRYGSVVRVRAYRLDEDLLAGLREAKVHQLADAAALTAREREVLDLILLGRSPREIAAVLSTLR